MNNAAIIIFYRSTLPKLLNFFAAPRIERSIQVGTEAQRITVHFIRCPVLKGATGNKRLARALEGLCLQHNISFFIGRDMVYCQQGGMPSIEGRIARGDVEEIKAIKDLGVLLKLSAESGTNLLKKNMCFVGESYSYKYISTMSEEAAGVYIFEHERLDAKMKKAIFEMLMAEKGISAVFTRNLQKAVEGCEVILADGTVELRGIQHSMAGKILLGGNAATGDFHKFDEVLLWYEALGNTGEDMLIAEYNNELLGILRHFHKERAVMDFLQSFAHIGFRRYCGAEEAGE